MGKVEFTPAWMIRIERSRRLHPSYEPPYWYDEKEITEAVTESVESDDVVSSEWAEMYQEYCQLTNEVN